MTIKPGYTTTEFIATLAMLVVTGAVLLGVITQGESAGVEAMVVELLIAISALLAASSVVKNYVTQCTILKEAELHIQDQSQTAPPPSLGADPVSGLDQHHTIH